MSITTRLENHKIVAAELAKISDADLAAKILIAKQIHTGIGGTAAKLEFAGVPVFAKKIALTDLEIKNPHSTRNLFELPTYYQFGVGSAGFGVWRELSAHQMTTKWVLDGECPNFPLLHGFKIVARDKPTETINEEELQIRTQYWGNSQAVTKRLRAIHYAKYDVVVFLEYAPQNLCEYMSPQASEGTRTARPNMEMVEQNINSTAAFMASKGLLHLDTHHGNIVTDGEQLYFTDFGLAISQNFELSAAEREFFSKNKGYDQALALSCFDWPAKTRNGEVVAKLPEVAAVAQKYKTLSALTEKFREELRDDRSKQVEYPAAKMMGLLRQINEQS